MKFIDQSIKALWLFGVVIAFLSVTAISMYAANLIFQHDPWLLIVVIAIILLCMWGYFVNESMFRSIVIIFFTIGLFTSCQKEDPCPALDQTCEVVELTSIRTCDDGVTIDFSFRVTDTYHIKSECSKELVQADVDRDNDEAWDNLWGDARQAVIDSLIQPVALVCVQR